MKRLIITALLLMAGTAWSQGRVQVYPYNNPLIPGEMRKTVVVYKLARPGIKNPVLIGSDGLPIELEPGDRIIFEGSDNGKGSINFAQATPDTLILDQYPSEISLPEDDPNRIEVIIYGANVKNCTLPSGVHAYGGNVSWSDTYAKAAVRIKHNGGDEDIVEYDEVAIKTPDHALCDEVELDIPGHSKVKARKYTHFKTHAFPTRKDQVIDRRNPQKPATDAEIEAQRAQLKKQWLWLNERIRRAEENGNTARVIALKAKRARWVLNDPVLRHYRKMAKGDPEFGEDE